jgi:carbonic anhydrase
MEQIGPSPAIDAMLVANRKYAASFHPGQLRAQPRKRLAVVLCMDARIDPIAVLGLAYGDAHIIRNAGGRMADALRSLAVSQAMLGTGEVAIIHHTRCGMAEIADDAIREEIRRQGRDPGDGPFHTFSSLEDVTREDVAIYRTSSLVRQDIPVRGFVFDVATGLLAEVDASGG